MMADREKIESGPTIELVSVKYIRNRASKLSASDAIWVKH
jgi:hypothetical protein